MKSKIIEIVELGQPKSLVQRENNPITKLIDTNLLIEELNQALRIHDVSNCPDLTNVWYKILEEHADDIPTRDKFCDALCMLEAGGFCQLKFAI